MNDLLKAHQGEWDTDIEQMKKDAGEIPENTCPDIDKALEELLKLEKEISYLENHAHKYESAEELVRDFPNVGRLDTFGILEALRKDNEQLRNLGRTWYEEYQSLHSGQRARDRALLKRVYAEEMRRWVEIYDKRNMSTETDDVMRTVNTQTQLIARIEIDRLDDLIKQLN